MAENESDNYVCLSSANVQYSWLLRVRSIAGRKRAMTGISNKNVQKAHPHPALSRWR